MKTRAQLKADALRIFQAGLEAVNPRAAISRWVRIDGSRMAIDENRSSALEFDLSRIKRIALCGAGKASVRMAQALRDLLGDRVTEGMIVTKYGHAEPVERVEVTEAGHPVPDENGVRATRRMMAALERLDAEALVLFCVSGGGSALLCAPAEGIFLEDKQKTTDLLLAAGADIHEINTVRKHISAVKGGQLARIAHPARVISLLLSDVIGDQLDAIASGPTVPDPSTFSGAAVVFDRYDLWRRAPGRIAEHLRQGLRGEIAETPKPGDPLLSNSHSVLVGSNRVCLQACTEESRRLGYHAWLHTDALQGESREKACELARMAAEIRATGDPVRKPACLIAGGETTVTMNGADRGLGGRNQEFSLAAAATIAGMPGVAVFSAGTDGTDGPTDAAGAIAFGDTLERGRKLGLSGERHLLAHDAYPFFQALGDLIVTGPTGTNVMDVHLVLVG